MIMIIFFLRWILQNLDLLYVQKTTLIKSKKNLAKLQGNLLPFRYCY